MEFTRAGRRLVERQVRPHMNTRMRFTAIRRLRSFGHASRTGSDVETYDMSVVRSNRGRGPGQWWPSRHADGRRSATFYCPLCGTPLSLAHHTITDAGDVVPSVDAPLHGEPYLEHGQWCRFHGTVQLVGWRDDYVA